MGEYTDNGLQLNDDERAAEARLARKALGLAPSKGDLAFVRAQGREAVNRLVRGTALLEPGEETDGWVLLHKAKVIESFHTKTRTAEETAFLDGFIEAADEAIADLQAYKNKLYGREG